jgi:hypothetical protein
MRSKLPENCRRNSYATYALTFRSIGEVAKATGDAESTRISAGDSVCVPPLDPVLGIIGSSHQLCGSARLGGRRPFVVSRMQSLVPNGSLIVAHFPIAMSKGATSIWHPSAA